MFPAASLCEKPCCLYTVQVLKRLDHSTPTMGKSCKAITGKKALRSMKKDLPFMAEKEPSLRKMPRNMRAKQREVILCGLKHIKAPVDP